MTIDVSTWDEVPANNTTIDSVSIAENCSPANMNNMGRAIMAGVKTFKLAYDALAASVATLTGTQTLTNKTLTSPAINTPTITGGTIDRPMFVGSAKQTDYTITDAAAFEINPANGSRQYVTLTANRTPKATNFANGDEMVLAVDDGTSAYTLTWTDTTFGASGIKWVGSAPTFGTTGWNWIALWKYSGQVYGAFVGNSG